MEVEKSFEFSVSICRSRIFPLSHSFRASKSKTPINDASALMHVLLVLRGARLLGGHAYVPSRHREVFRQHVVE